MSEEKNIEDEPRDNNPQPTENLSTENIQPVGQTETQITSSDIPTSEIKNMEVHKHPHHVTHKKKWGEYLLEFFMLFLAVFLGFVAENIREHKVENDRAKEYALSLV